MPGKADPVLRIILENYSDPQFNVSALAEKTGRSASYLCEKSYSRYGMNIHQVIETVRLEQAIKLLATDDNKIDYIRIRVGYMYAKSFRRAFKKRLGLPPCECKERVLNAETKEHEVEYILEHLWKAN